MKVLITGSSGFIGKNLVLRLKEKALSEVIVYSRENTNQDLLSALAQADAVIHLAGENRPTSSDAFEKVNAGLTRSLCDSLRTLGRSSVPVLFASSTQASSDNPYGRSKLAAEHALLQLAEDSGNPVAIYRLPGVFGKWCKPNYNSVVATFCHSKANDRPIQIKDEKAQISLVYVEDVVSAFVAMLFSDWSGVVRTKIKPEYNITLGELAKQIDAFKNCRSTLVLERVGSGLTRALYATYVSYLPKNKFAYLLPTYLDGRGLFVEVLKTHDSGQISYFTSHPGETRGEHYHHTKTEKFLVIKGKARFGFRHILTDETYYLETDGSIPQVVETVPGWTHDITNVGVEELVVMLWANEIFDRTNPDTISCKL